jgi:hypothetical protein
MTNLFQNTTSGFAELKTRFEGPIKSQLNDDVPSLRAAEKVTKGWNGYEIKRPLKVRRNQGVGATSDGGNLPSIGRQTTVFATIGARFNYLRFGLTGPMIKASASDPGSFVRAAAFELEQGYIDLKKEINRQLGWDSTGTIATVGANAIAATSLTIAGRESTEQALKFLDVGATVDIVTSAGVYEASGVLVTGITTGTPESLTAVVTLGSAVTATSGSYIVRSGSYNLEEHGLLSALDGNTTSYFGVDRSLYQTVRGNVIDLSGGQLTLDALQQVETAAVRRGGAAKNGAWMSDLASQRFYLKLLTPDKRYTNTIEGDGGFARKGDKYPEMNGKAWVGDPDFPTRIAYLNAETWKNYVLCELEFADETGSMLIAQTGTDTFEARVRYFADYFCEMPAANGVLRNYISP